MIALLVYVIIGVAVLILSPILFAAFGLYMIIAVGLVFGGIHLALYILDILTLEGLFVIIGLGVGYLVLKSASNTSLAGTCAEGSVMVLPSSEAVCVLRI